MCEDGALMELWVCRSFSCGMKQEEAACAYATLFCTQKSQCAYLTYRVQPGRYKRREGVIRTFKEQ